MKRTKLLLGALTIAFAGLVCQYPLPPEAPPLELRVSNLQAKYNPKTATTPEYVYLTWNGPDPATFDYYKIYRTDARTIEGDFDTSMLVSDNQRVRVDKNVTSYSDAPGLGNTEYLYAVRAVKLFPRANGQWDTIVGLLDAENMATVSVGSDVNFNISNGDIFTASRATHLVVNDPAPRIDRVRFTQNYRSYLVDSLGKSVEVFFDDPYNPPDTLTIGKLIDAGFLNARAELNKNVVNKLVPDFDAADTANPLRTALRASYSGDRIVFPWKLRMGNGSKQVWAEVRYAETGEIDTISDKIEIAPYRIQLYFRNKIGTADATMRKQGGTGATLYYIYKPWIEFTVSIFADTTISPDFSYWLIVPAWRGQIVGNIRSAAYDSWLETSPRFGRLTDIGAGHDDSYRYLYTLDLQSPNSEHARQARENLAELKKTSSVPDTNTAFILRAPKTELNWVMSPGSYWGPDPRDWIPYAQGVNRNLSHQQSIVRGTPEALFDSVKYLFPLDARTRGLKEFVLVARFVGNQFGDVRPALTGSEIVPGTYAHAMINGNRSYFDLYPPVMNFNPKAPYALKNGDVVSANMLNFAPGLKSVIAFTDQGLANIVDLRLIIAKKPEDMIFDPAKGISLANLYALRCQIFPYEIKTAANTLADVGWFNIDSSTWPSGEYIMAVVAKDQYGNEGFAASGSDYPNPWVVTILTGK